MTMFADAMSNFDIHMGKINTNGLVLLSNHRRPYDHGILTKRAPDSDSILRRTLLVYYAEEYLNLLRICKKYIYKHLKNPPLLTIKRRHLIKS